MSHYWRWLKSAVRRGETQAQLTYTHTATEISPCPAPPRAVNRAYTSYVPTPFGRPVDPEVYSMKAASSNVPPLEAFVASRPSVSVIETELSMQTTGRRGSPNRS